MMDLEGKIDLKLQEGELYVGWSEVSITPPKPVKLRGQFYERISQYVQSEIVVSVLALETRDSQGESMEQLMIGACDLCDVSKELLAAVRERLAGKLQGFNLEKLFLSATHTHTGPVVGDGLNVAGEHIYKYIPEKMWPPTEDAAGIMEAGEYREFLIERLCTAFMDAWENRKLGLVNWQLGHAVVGHNRRLVYDDGSAQMYGSSDTINFDCIEGPVDHGLELLYLWDETEKVTGVVVNVACPSQVVEGQYFISADYWDTVREELRKSLSADLFILPLCGAAGDQSPRDLIRRGRGEPSMREVEGAVEMGKRIATAVVSKYEAAAEDKKGKLEFGHLVANIDLPVKTVTRQEYEEAKLKFSTFINSKKPGERIQISEISRFLHVPGGIIERFESQQHTAFYSPEIHVIRLGEIAIASNPFELFTDYGLRMKARSRAEQLFIIQLACDSGKYLPTAKAARGGSYSAIVASGIVGPEGGRILVEQTVKMINNLFRPYLDSDIT